MIDIWRKRFILSDSDQPTSLVDIRPTEERHGVLDPKTFEAIEAEALFETVDHTRTETGRLALYRSFASPQQDAQVLQQKQTALREIESNTPLREALERWHARLDECGLTVATGLEMAADTSSQKHENAEPAGLAADSSVFNCRG